VKAEKVIRDYFKDKTRFPTSSDIAHQARFLLGVDNAKGEIPWLFQNGPDATSESVVRTLSNMLDLPLIPSGQSMTGYYRSPFIVDTLAVHFKHLQTCPTALQVHPAGVLALTLTAVKSRAFLLVEF
jgi:hypothetical protein